MLLLRRLRGMLGTALVWAIVWCLAGGAIIAPAMWWYEKTHDDGPASFGEILVTVLMNLSIWGAVSGAFFALLLAIAERRRTVNELSMARVVGWGLIGGAALPLISISTALLRARLLMPSQLSFIATIVAVAGLLGAVCAGGTLALVRGGPTSA